MINLFKKQRPSSTLGLVFDGNRLDIVALRRTNGSIQVQHSLTATLALSPSTSDPELVGREIRNHLDLAGIRERKCVVCLPLSWALTVHSALPDLPDADIDSFLQIEGERGFPSAPDTLMIGCSRSKASNGEQHATQIAVPRNHIANLESALKFAQLKPTSFSLGITALQPAQADGGEGVLTLALGANNVDLQVASGGGIVALRFLDGATEAEGAQKRLDPDIVAREIRITLGQLPVAFQSSVRTVKIFGRGDTARRFFSEIAPRAQAMGLKAEWVERCGPGHFANIIPTESLLSPALALAAMYLGGAAPALEFLPPKVHPWQQLIATRMSSKKLAWAGAIVGGLILCVCFAFLIQQWRISTRETEWKTMEAQVKSLETSQQQIKRFRPWFDESYRTLSILRRLTEAFPEDGSVSAKSVEIRDPAVVTCSAVARDTQAYLHLLDKLRATRGISSVNFEQVRGQSPVQFSFNFQWEGENSHAN